MSPARRQWADDSFTYASRILSSEPEQATSVRMLNFSVLWIFFVLTAAFGFKFGRIGKVELSGKPQRLCRLRLPEDGPHDLTSLTLQLWTCDLDSRKTRLHAENAPLGKLS